MEIIKWLPWILFLTGLVLTAGGIVMAINKENIYIEGVLFVLGGLLTSGSMMFASPATQAGILHDIRAWSLLGVNIMLLVFITAAFFAGYEVFHPKTAPNSNHYMYSQMFAYIAGLTAPLWSFHGLRPAGIGVILLVAGLIVTLKRGAEAKVVACVLIAAGCALASMSIIDWSTSEKQAHVLGGIVVGLGLGFFGLLVILQHRNKDGRYHWFRGPLYGGICAALIVVGGGTLVQSALQSGATGGTQLAAKYSDGKHPGHGMYGNPLDLATAAIRSSMLHHAEAHGAGGK